MDVGTLPTGVIVGLETLYLLIICSSCFFVWKRAKSIYAVSSYRGARYFGDAFLFWGITFAIRYLWLLGQLFIGEPIFAEFSLVSTGLALIVNYMAIAGGFYLFHSIGWQCCEGLERKKVTCRPETWLHVFAAAISAFQVFTSLASRHNNKIILFAVLLITLLATLLLGIKQAKKKGKDIINVYSIAVILSFLSVFIIFLSEMFIHTFPNLTIYAYGVVSVLFLLVALKVGRITSGGK